MLSLRALFSVFVLFSTAVAADPLRCPSKTTHLTMERGEYSPLAGASFVLSDFSADMVARGKTSPLCFNRTTQVAHGVVFISSESLTKLFTQKLRQSSSKVSDVKVNIKDDNTAQLTGTLHKAIGIPFEIDGPVSTDGKVLQLQAKKIKAEKLPVKGLLGMIGKDLGSLLGSESVSGVTAKGDTLIFEPEKIAHVEGHMAEAKLERNGLQITFDGGAPKHSSKTITAHNKHEAATHK